MENNIDKFFFDKLNNASKAPRSEAWDKLSGQLNKSKNKGWIFYISVAASLLILISMSLVYNQNLTEKTDLIGHLTKNKLAKNKINTKRINKNQLTIRINSENIINSTTVEKIIKQNKNYKKSDLPKPITHDTNQYYNTITLIDKSPDIVNNNETIKPLNYLTKLDKQIIVLYESELYIPQQKLHSKSKMGKILTQIKHFKKGEKVNLNEIGIDKENILATIKEKFN